MTSTFALRLHALLLTGALALAGGATVLANTTAPAPAPAFELAARGGGELGLDDFEGQVVMINFWATWCAPCRKEMPLLESIYQRYAPLGFTMIGINVEPDSRAAEAWLAEQGPVSFPILFDTDSEVSKLYRVNGMPNSVIIDRKGNVRVLHRGYKPGDENEYLMHIRALLRE